MQRSAFRPLDLVPAPASALRSAEGQVRGASCLALLVGLTLLVQPASAQVEAPLPGAFIDPSAAVDPSFVDPFELSRITSASAPLPEPKGPAEILGRVGGQVGPMALSSDGQNGYLAMGNGFLVLDQDDPARPLARIDLEAEWVAGVAVFENALYVSIWPPFCCPRDTYGSLLVYDLSDPIAPRYVDQRGLHRSSGPIAIDAEARRAYVAGLAFDLQNPLDPQDLGLVSMASVEDAPSVFAAGIGYLASTLEPGRTQISVSDMAELPSHTILATLAVDGEVRALDVQGQLLAAAADGALHLLVRSHPDRLIQVGRASLPMGVRDVEIAGQILVVATEDGVIRFDISDPSRPLEIARWMSGAPARELGIGLDQVILQGERAWLVAPRAGLLEMRLQDGGDALAVTMPLFTLLGGQRMAVSGPLALVVQGATSPNEYFVDSLSPASALALVDLSDPAWPRVTAQLDRYGNVADVAALGERFFVARHLDGVQELHAEPDGGLRLFTEISEPAGRLAIDPDLGRLYLGFASGAGLQLAAYDLQDPAGPVFLARHVVPALHSDLQLHASEGRLYVGTERGLSIFHVDEIGFELETHRDLPGGVRAIQSSGRNVYATGGSALHSLYRSRSIGLQLLGSAELHDRSNALDWFRSSVAGPLVLRGGRAWVGDEAGTNAKGRLHQVDLTDAWTLRVLGVGVGRPGRVHDLALEGETLWILDETAGLMSMRVGAVGD